MMVELPPMWDFIVSWLENLLGIDLLLKAQRSGQPVPVQAIFNLVFSSITLVFTILLLYKTVYLIVGIFGKSPRYKVMPKDKKYAFLLPAKDEEKVIGNLIDSIRNMDYPQELIDIYVIADNCSDNTASIAKEHGAIVYERHDLARKRKGFALHDFFEDFKKSKNIEDYYAYTILDADNVVAPTFLSKINDGLQDGKFDAAIGYRNATNLSENIVTAMCGMNIYVSIVSGIRARSIFKTTGQLYGPSSTFRSYLLKDGWKWDTLTEDLDLEIDLAAENKTVGYVEEAEMFEEEPDKVGLFIKQQMRWSRGNLQTFFKYAGKTIKSFFKKPTWGKYDMFFQIFPYSIFYFYFSLLYQIASLVLFFIVGDAGYNWFSFLNYVLTTLGGVYVGNFITNIFTIIKEWKKFHLSFQKTILYIFLFPFYWIVYLPIAAASIFINVGWKHIDHHYVADVNKLMAEEESKNK